MDKSVLLFCSLLISGCASVSDDPYQLIEAKPTSTPSQAQEMRQNPALLQCGERAAPLCRVASGGRVRKTYKNCTCATLR